MKPETTTYEVTITHYKPIPTHLHLSDVIASRAYNFLYANGLEVGVDVKLVKDEGDADAE